MQNWYSRIEYLNDPFELFFNDKTGTEVFKLFKKSICICSFSKNRNEILMWSHYSENHTGICLEYEFDQEVNKGSFFEIEYCNEILTIEKVDFLDSGHLSLNIKTNGKFITQKFKTWEYEQEIRTIRLDSDYNVKGISGKFLGELTGIYFGKNSSPNDIQRIKLNTRHYKNLKYYKVDLDAHTSKMDLVNEI
jgi:hypothetical protein